ncbi:MAG: zinc-ribbon domain-containing protein [Acidobacteria bacterium]|nr:zinc-ribbon domain-containing protein [Acidobacteriota bacterium]
MTKYCIQCGAQVAETARFCNKCGAQLLPTQPQSAEPPGYQQPNYQTPPNYQQQYQQPGYGQTPYQPMYQPQTTGGELKPNVAGMLCYPLLLVTGILFLVLTPYNKNRFVRFHAYQAIFFSIALFILSIAIGIIGIPLPWRIERALSNLHTLLWLAGTGWSMFQAYKGQMFKLPFIGDLAETQANK